MTVQGFRLWKVLDSGMGLAGLAKDKAAAASVAFCGHGASWCLGQLGPIA